MTIEKAQDSAAPTGAASVLSAGLGLMGRLRDWSDWSKSQAEDELSSLLGSAADEIERLRAALEDATEDRRTQYMTPEERAKRQDAMNSALRNALDNVALVRPNVK